MKQMAGGRSRAALQRCVEMPASMTSNRCTVLFEEATNMRFLSIAQRLALIVGLLVFVIVGIVTVESVSFRAGMIQERRAEIRGMTDSVIALAKRYDEQVAAGHMGLPEAEAAVQTAAHGMRWGNGDYYLIYQYDGLTLVHGNPQYENVNRL